MHALLEQRNVSLAGILSSADGVAVMMMGCEGCLSPQESRPMNVVVLWLLNAIPFSASQSTCGLNVAVSCLH